MKHKQPNTKYIQPSIKSIAQLIESNVFVIPDYQRQYSWTKYERGALFEDIKKLHSKGDSSIHYLATVVCLNRGKKKLGIKAFDQLEVVDGQQRLTTLIMLLKAIQLNFNESISKEQNYAKDVQELLVKPGSERLLLLQTNHGSSFYFSNFIKDDRIVEPEKAKNFADRETLEAIKDCMKFVGDWLKDGKSLELLTGYVLNSLFVVLHEITDEKMVYTVFEVLNSRGLEVTSFDSLKSNLMGSAYELKNIDNSALIKELKNVWKKIYSIIGLHKWLDTEILVYAATLYHPEIQSRPLNEKDSVAIFQYQARSAEDIRRIAQFLLEVAQACAKLRENHRINAVTRINQARLLAVALILRVDMLENEFEQLIRQWENVTFRIYGLIKSDARLCVGEYVRLAWEVHNDKLNPEEIKTCLHSIGNEFTIENAVEHLRKVDNSYDYWKEELRYLMFRYEEYLAKDQKFTSEEWNKIWIASPSKSIEHILAQNNAPEHIKHNLGNLLMLPPRLNSALQDYDFKDKRQAYKDTGLKIAQKVATDHRHKRVWSVRAIKARKKELLDWIKIEWGD